MDVPELLPPKIPPPVAGDAVFAVFVAPPPPKIDPVPVVATGEAPKAFPVPPNNDPPVPPNPVAVGVVVVAPNGDCDCPVAGAPNGEDVVVEGTAAPSPMFPNENVEAAVELLTAAAAG